MYDIKHLTKLKKLGELVTAAKQFARERDDSGQGIVAKLMQKRRKTLAAQRRTERVGNLQQHELGRQVSAKTAVIISWARRRGNGRD